MTHLELPGRWVPKSLRGFWLSLAQGQRWRPKVKLQYKVSFKINWNGTNIFLLCACSRRQRCSVYLSECWGDWCLRWDTTYREVYILRIDNPGRRNQSLNTHNFGRGTLQLRKLGKRSCFVICIMHMFRKTFPLNLKRNSLIRAICQSFVYHSKVEVIRMIFLAWEPF